MSLYSAETIKGTNIEKLKTINNKPKVFWTDLKLFRAMVCEKQSDA